MICEELELELLMVIGDGRRWIWMMDDDGDESEERRKAGAQKRRWR
jgi:hypothetical protein